MTNRPQRLLTAEEFAAMPQADDWKEELVDGVLYRFPPPGLWHGVVCGNLAGLVGEFCKTTGFGRSSLGSGLVVARNPDSVPAPDVQVFSARRPPDTTKGWPSVPPAFIAEVVDGPADYHFVMAKVPLYLAFGVSLVWVVRPPLADVQVYRLADHPAPVDRWRWIGHDATAFTRLQGHDQIDGDDVLPGFSCRVSDLFA